MKFESLRCDECGRIQGEANHWLTLHHWSVANKPNDIVISLGENSDLMIGVSDFSTAQRQEHDLCGQSCMVKHLAKLLGWSSVLEAQKD